MQQWRLSSNRYSRLLALIENFEFTRASLELSELATIEGISWENEVREWDNLYVVILFFSHTMPTQNVEVLY